MTVASLAIVAAPLAASAQSFDHNRNGGGDRHASQDRGAYGRQDQGRGDYGRGRGWDRGNGGAAFAAGITGLFLGAALADSQGYNAGPSYGYAQPYAYDQGYDCGWTTQTYRDRYGNLETRQVNTCG